MKMINKKNGFTLIELLTVIAIIGILASIVLVSTQSGVEKSKKASAITTASSVFPELVTCEDDNGFAKSSIPTAGTTPVCCATSAACGSGVILGHSVLWPDIKTKTGWDYSAVSGTLANGDYKFILHKDDQTDIVCDMAKNSCD